MENYLFKKYKQEKHSLFIETGSYIGEGVEEAIEADFEKIISIELSPHYFDLCSNKFKENNKVSIVFGNSETKLKEVLENNADHKKIFFWLDAHGSGGNTEGGRVIDTLSKELETIQCFCKNFQIEATLVLDDIIPEDREFVDKLGMKFIGKENCVNKFTSEIQTNRSVYVYEI